MQPSILVIEDDEPIRTFLQEFLQEEGYIVESVSHGTVALQRIENRQPDLVILDLGLPDIEGETVLTVIKKNYAQLQILILTAKAGADNIAKGLNLGADDYLVKPFSADELLARVKARIRSGSGETKEYRIEDLVVNVDTREVTRGGKLIVLTKTEFDLLYYLLKHRGQVVTRDMILNHVWGYTTDVESRVVDVYIGYVRKKIGMEFGRKLIYSMRGVGYLVKS